MFRTLMGRTSYWRCSYTKGLIIQGHIWGQPSYSVHIRTKFLVWLVSIEYVYVEQKNQSRH